MENLERLFDDLFSGKRVVVVTGAGISTASGIPDFRSSNGLYNQSNEELYAKYPYLQQEMLEYYSKMSGVPIGDFDEKAANIYLMSRTFFKKHPDAFYDFYTSNKILSDDVKPNICHEVLVKLEEAGYVQSIITQNIDNLHQEAGSKNVFPIHGTNKFYCECCHKEYSKEHYVNAGYECTHVDEKGNKCEGIIRPDIVFYEEGYNEEKFNNCMREAVCSEVMIVAGSSITVSTIINIINAFLRWGYPGKKLYILNNQPTCFDKLAIERIDGNLSDIFKEIGEKLDILRNKGIVRKLM